MVIKKQEKYFKYYQILARIKKAISPIIILKLPKQILWRKKMLKKITAIITTAVFALGFALPVFAVTGAAATTLTVYAGGTASTTFANDGGTPAGTLDYNFIDPSITPAPGLTKIILTSLGTGTITDDSVSYTARLDSNVTGAATTDTLDYQLDDDGNVSTSTVTVNIIKSNITAEDQTYPTAVPAGSTVSGQLTTVEGTAGLEPGGTLYFQILSDSDTEARTNPYGTPHGTLTVNSDGTYSYTSDPTATSADMFYFVAGDSAGGASVGSILFNIQSLPSATPTITPTVTPTIAPTVAPTPTIQPWGYVDIVGSWVQPYADKEARDGTFIGPKVGNDYFFLPTTPVTRSDFVILLDNALGLNVADYANQANPFADTIPAWQLPYAKAAYYSKVIDGVDVNGQRYFAGDDILTRDQAVKMIYNAATAKAAIDVSGVTLGYADASTIPDWAIDAVKYLTQQGVVNGYDDNTFRPETILDRAAAIKILSLGKAVIASIPVVTATPAAPTATVAPTDTVAPSPTDTTAPAATDTAAPMAASPTASVVLSGQLFDINE